MGNQPNKCMVECRPAFGARGEGAVPRGLVLRVAGSVCQPQVGNSSELVMVKEPVRRSEALPAAVFPGAYCHLWALYGRSRVGQLCLRQIGSLQLRAPHPETAFVRGDWGAGIGVKRS